MVKSRYIGDGHPTKNRNPNNGYINPYYWVDEFIPYYMEIMGVDRPDRTYAVSTPRDFTSSMWRQPKILWNLGESHCVWAIYYKSLT